ncbi:MAG TPA: hypothetical protein VFA79_19965 [Myxococcales bacterium]|nr:hypothetical protein [Myxococcales bacterium]
MIVLMPLAAHAAQLEFEIAPGYTWSNDISASAPVLRGRVGIEFPWFTPSIVGVGAFLEDPGPLVHQRQGGGWTGLGVAAEARFHTNGEQRLFVALGAGWGQLSALQAENGDTEGYRGMDAPYVEAALGYQWVGDGLRLGLEVTLDVFNRVNLMGDLGSRICVDSVSPGSGGFVMVCPTGRSFSMIGLALTIGFAPRH